MTSNTISIGDPAGYVMSVGTLTITATGSIGGNGLAASAAATIFNYGVILATSAGVEGVRLGGGGRITNGNASAYADALIAGAIGVETTSYSAVATVINYGTIDGTGGTAVAFQSSGDVLVVEAGSSFSGVVAAYSETNQLHLGTAAGAGTISGLGTEFTGFSTYAVDAGSSWTLDGTNTISVSNATLSVLGSLSIAGALDSHGTIGITGSLVVTGSLANAGSISGQVTLIQGTLTNGAGATISSGGFAVYGNASGGAGDTVLNLGVITSSAGMGPAVSLGYNGGPSIITNGTAGATAALVSGYTGLNLYGHATVVNYGTIRGRDGTAVYVEANASSQTNVVVVEAGSVFDGQVAGGGGTLELGAGAGAGTLAGLSSQFTAFGVLEIQAGGTWSLGTSNTLTNYGTALNYGTLHGTAGYALVLSDAGTIANGSGGDTTALISSARGVEVSEIGALAGVVLNYATISDTSNAGAAVSLGLASGGGQVANGSVTDPDALIAGGGYGISFSAVGTVTNFATIVGRTGEGIFIIGGGTVTNGTGVDTAARITGDDDGVGIVGSAGTVRNFGTLVGAGHYGVALGAGGLAVNGSATDGVALIEGQGGVEMNAVGTVLNYGTVSSTGPANAGVFTQGGTVTNGSDADSRAEITGVIGIEANGSVTVTNDGTVAGSTSDGVFLSSGGNVSNGNAGDLAALISGSSGIVANAAATVVNAGTILGADAVAEYGLNLSAGGTLTNGGVTDGSALVEGYEAVQLGASGLVANLGTLDGLGSDGVGVVAGGTVSNGGGSDRAALIEGLVGVDVSGTGTITNLGTIRGLAGFGAVLHASGTVTNGAINDSAALIEGTTGLDLAGAATATNLGTIRGTGEAGSAGAVLGAGANLNNGGSGDPTALVQGYTGVTVGGGTLRNFGRISGADGTAVLLTSAAGLVGVASDAVFEGKVVGDGGTLDLLAVGGAGTFTGIGSEFSGFGLAQVIAGATWTLAGTNVVASGELLADHGVLKLTGNLTNSGNISGGVTLAAGTLIDSAGHTVSGSGTVVSGSGTVTNLGVVTASGAGSVGIDLAGGAVANGNASVTTALIAGTTGLILGGPGIVTDFGTIRGTGGTALLFKSAKDVLVLESKGVLAGKAIGDGGTLNLAAGTATLAGLGSSLSGFGLVDVAVGGHWTLSGTSTIASSTALLDQGVLTNAGTILDSGAITVGVSGTPLVIQAAGVLDLEGNNGIAATGGGSGAFLANAGLVQKLAGTGTSLIAVKVGNTGTVTVSSGTLDLEQAVDGTGTLKIAGSAALEAAGLVVAGQTVKFSAGAESLVLTDPAGFAGALSGFAATDKLDLRTFAFGTSEHASFAEHAGNTFGTLTVTDGALHFSVKLFGQYSNTFAVASDGHGGTSVTYTPPPKPPELGLSAPTT